MKVVYVLSVLIVLSSLVMAIYTGKDWNWQVSTLLWVLTSFVQHLRIVRLTENIEDKFDKMKKDN